MTNLAEISIQLLIIISLFFTATGNQTVLAGQSSKCPELLKEIVGNNCDNVKCEKLTEELCPASTIYIENFALCKCCPTCVQYMGIDETCVPGDDPQQPNVIWTRDSTCEIEDNYCPVKVNLCYPGLVCNTEENKCELPTEFPDPTRSCMYRKSLYRLSQGHYEHLHHWDPKCEPDGSFSPKQCKGSHYSGECFCVKSNGERIFGREWRFQSENQTCACSRKVEELRARKLISTIHCAPDGNFEHLQCDTDSSLCYCVEPKTGEIVGPVVPQSQWKMLPCFSLNVTDGNLDGKYLRQCESEYAAIKILEIENAYHGTRLEMKGITMSCDYDGSFSPVLEADTTYVCVYKNGSRIGDYSTKDSKDINCACARDTMEYYPSHERPRLWQCMDSGTAQGNYKPVNDFGTYASCVDPDGFLYGEQNVPSRYMCCLGFEGCLAASINAKCFHEENNPDGFRKCNSWAFGT